LSYPIRFRTPRTTSGISTYASVVTSPETMATPVVTIVSTATRLRGSWVSMASRIPSEIWSATLSGWPSVTDSEVKRCRSLMGLVSCAFLDGFRIELI
jgi:hypothetical protein